MPGMFDRLREAENRYDAIETELAQPETGASPGRMAQLLSEHKRLTPVIEGFRSYCRAKADLEDAETLLAETDDPELRLLCAEETKQGKLTVCRLEEQLRRLLLPQDPDDARDVMVEIRAAAGGEEAALFAYDLYRMYNMYASSVGFGTELLDENETKLGGFREVVFRITGENVYSHLKYESGVHRVQRVPVTETQGRIQTSTVTVAVLPEAEEIEIAVRPEDLKVDTIKSTGAGGQHINKTESAVRITHKPTGIVVECQEERSQFKNRDKAMKMLRTRLYDMQRREQTDKIAASRRAQVGTGDRSEKIRTYNFPQRRITDHRIGYTSYDLEAFMNGNIGELITALMNAETAEKLKESENVQR